MARIIAAALLVLAIVLGWRWFFPTEETKIKQRLEALADDASELTSDVAGMATAARIGTYFTEDIVIERAEGTLLQGRQVILAAAAQFRPAAGQETTVAIHDVDVTLAPDRVSATVTLTATVSRNAGTPDETTDADAFTLTLRKANDTWLISRVRSIAR